jgi:uncharacterized membrane protein
LKADLAAHKRAIVRVDCAFLLVFAAFLLLRCLWPDINNGEKPMDLALASACARADYLPPPNPYLAGTRLGGYYYLGHLQSALLTTTVGASFRWSYNFSCATLPALCASLALPLATLLCGSWRRGAFASLILLVAGTLEPLRQWIEPNEAGFTAWPRSLWNQRSLDYFSTSRVIPNPIHASSGVNYAINEYPFFTSTYGDLHAHFFAQPVALLAMSLGAALFFNRRARPGSRLTLGRVLLAGCVLAALAVTNTWDVPAYWLLIALCLFAPCADASTSIQALEGAPASKSARRRARRAQGPQQVLEGEEAAVDNRVCLSARQICGFLGVATAVMVALALPYLKNLHTNASPPTPLDLPATPPLAWLLMWGPFAVAWALALWRAWREDRRFRFHPLWLLLPVGAWALLRFGPAGDFSLNWLRNDPPGSDNPYKITYSWGPNESGADYFAPILLLTFIVLSLRGAFRARDARFALLCRLAVCGLVPMLWSELTWAGFLDRSLQGMTFHRQDTVFKFGLQGWFLFGLASIADSLSPRQPDEEEEEAEAQAPARAQGAWRWWPWPLQVGFGVALLVMFVSSVLCLWGRGFIKSAESLRQMSEIPAPWPVKFLSTFHAPDAWAHLAPSEMEAASWMAERARDGQSLLEADQQPDGNSDYMPTTRYAHATGIPAMVGPQSHTFQWGSGKLDTPAMWELVSKRKAQVQAIFRSNGAALRDPEWRQAMQRDFGLRFIVLGQLERQEFGDGAVAAMVASAPSSRLFGANDDEHRVVVIDLASSQN